MLEAIKNGIVIVYQRVLKVISLTLKFLVLQNAGPFKTVTFYIQRI